MSRNEWESGEVLLPTAEVTRLRRAMNAAAAREREAVMASVGTVWSVVRLVPVSGRERAVAQYVQGLQRVPQHYTSADEVVWERMSVVESLFARSGGRRPGEEDLAWCGFGAVRAPSRVRSWVCGEASVSLDGRRVSWRSGENNHAVERARSSWLGVAFFGFLSSVRWTRGTGSAGFVGNDEYHRDTESEGGGGNYVTERYGPLGAAAQDRPTWV